MRFLYITLVIFNGLKNIITHIKVIVVNIKNKKIIYKKTSKNVSVICSKICGDISWDEVDVCALKKR